MKIDRNLIARINRRLLAERKAQGVAGEKIHKVRAGWMRREFGEYALRKLSGELVTYGFDIRLMARDCGIRA